MKLNGFDESIENKKKHFSNKWWVEKAEKDQEKKLFGESNIEMGLAIDIHIMKCDKIANECSNKQISYL